MFDRVAATHDERTSVRAGDDLVPAPDVVMDTAFGVSAPPEQVWPWIVQLGKARAGWYLPARIERFLPPSRRALWHLDPRWLALKVGSVIPDYGGRHETFTVAHLDAPRALVYTSQRGRAAVSWAITLTAEDSDTRVHLRLRIAGLRRPGLVRRLGGWFDAATIAGMSAGLRERLMANSAG